MSLVDRQLATIINKLSKKYYLRGIDPTSTEIIKDLEEYLKEHQTGAPSTQLRVFGKRKKLDLDELNGFMSESKEDVDLLHADRIDLFLRTMRLLSSGNIRTDALRRQLLGLSDQLSEILLMTDRSTGVFFGFFDSFNDLLKIDTSSSIDIDLAAGLTTLPISDGLQRVIPDLPKIQAPKVAVPSTYVELATGNLPFREILNSTLSVWRKMYASSAEKPLEAEVVFKFVPEKHLIEDKLVARTRGTGEDKAEEVRISKLDIYPISTSNFKARISYSIDGVNFTPFEGYSDYLNMRGSKVSLLFPETVVQWIRFDIVVADFLQDSNGRNLYEFGFKELALYTAGYGSSGTLISTTLTPDATTYQAISKVALYAKERNVTDSSRIDYYVTDAALSTPNWIPIKNLGRPTDVNFEANTVDFRSTQTSEYSENQISVTATLTGRETVAGRTFYELATIPSTFKKGTAKLLRGVNCWRAKYSMLPITERRDNLIVDFASDNYTKPLYAYVKEIYKGTEVTVAANVATFTLRYSLYSDADVPALNDLISVYNNDGYNQTYPRSKVVRVTRKRGSILTAGSTLVSPITPAVFLYNGPKSKIKRVTNVTLGVIPRKGEYIRLTNTNILYPVDEVFKIVDTGTNYVEVIDSDNKLFTASDYTFEYSVEDMTALVDNTYSTGVTLKINKGTLVGNNNDVWEVEYWRDLTPDEEVATSTMVCTNLAGTIIYTAGVDYLYDPPSKMITALPGGSIYGTTTQVKLSFDINKANSYVQGPSTYSTFFEIDFKKPPTVADLNITNDYERAYIVFNGNEYAFTDSVALFQDIAKNPKSKWVQVVVVSNPVSDDGGSLDTGSALYKVIHATDQVTGLYVFKKGIFFKNQRAFLSPLLEIPYFKLKYDTYPGDRSVFSVDSDDVIINWDPVNQLDLLYLAPAGAVAKREDFELQYSYTIDSDEVVTSLKLKAEFSRDPSEPPYVTPVLEEYSLRLSY